MATNATRVDGRRAERRRADAPSTVRSGASGPLEAIVRDISLTGACIDCASDLVLGEFVSVGIGGVGAVRAVVVWRRQTLSGLEFLEPLTAQEMERAFAAEIVVPFAPVAYGADADLDEDDEEEEGVYAEASGWLSALAIVVLGGTAAAVAILRGWIF